VSMIYVERLEGGRFVNSGSYHVNIPVLEAFKPIPKSLVSEPMRSMLKANKKCVALAAMLNDHYQVDEASADEIAELVQDPEAQLRIVILAPKRE
jgi:hypothetical protein